MRLIAAVGCCLIAGALPLATPCADEVGAAPAAPERWVIGSVGTFALVEAYDYPYLVGLQYRSTPRTTRALMPGVGVAGGPDGMGYFYADVAHDFPLPRRWTLTLSLAAGLFINGDAVGVNEHLEFQSGIAFARRLSGGTRIGFAVYHISNGGLEHPNNGTEALVVSLAVPVNRSR